MTKQQYFWLRIATVIIVSASTSFAVLTRNYLILIGLIPLASLILILARRTVKEIMADERDYETAGKAAFLSMKIFSLFSVILVLVLLVLRDANPYYEAIGTSLAFAVCFLMFLYSIIFKYYDRFVMSEKKWVYVVIGIIAFAIATMAGLRLISGEDNWVCDKGVWVKHGNPDYPAPTIKCE